MAASYRRFRVYNDIDRVGVGFQIGDTFYGLQTAAVAGAVLVATLAGAGAFAKVWPAAAITIAIIGGLTLMWISLIVLRLGAMARYAAAGSANDRVRLQEKTQIRLLWEQTRHPVYRNFATPDDDGTPVYRNYQ